MKKFTKRFSALFLAAALMVPTVASAAPDVSEQMLVTEIGKKTAEAQVNPGDYEITLSVPGAFDSEKYNEIIVMVDASSSQGANLATLKTTLVDIAEEVLHNDGSVRLTLMGFGMGPATVGSFYNAETLEEYLKDVTQADLRQGVSATNCEAALEYIQEYIENSDDLNKTCVLFTSDGMANMDEVTFNLCDWELNPDWYANNFSTAYMGAFALECQVDSLLSGGAITNAAVKNFPEDAASIEIAKAKYGVDSEEYKAAVEKLYDANCDDAEACISFADDLITDAHVAAGLSVSQGYSTSDYEKLFLEYYDGAFFNFYLYTIFGITQDNAYSDHYKKSTWGARAADAADVLCENDKVLNLYMVDFAGKANTWMNPASTTGNQVTSDKITYLRNTSYGAAIDSIKNLSSEMFTTLYENTTIIDPMSKWVTLDEGSIRIYEDDLLIWENGNWLYEDKQPAKNPVTITTDATTGHKVITWRIKDGALLFTDRYYLKYEVDVDETVEGFVYGTDYPANDPTHVTYTDETGEEKIEEIEVPEVHQPVAPDDFDEGDMGFRIYKGSSKDKTPISDITFKIYNVVAEDGDTLSAKPEKEEYSKYMTDDSLVGSITTNAAGYAALNVTDAGYGEGIYLIVEEASDKVEAPVDPFYVTLPMVDPETGDDINIVNIYPKNTPIEEDPLLPPVIPGDDPDSKTGKITILKHLEGNVEKVLKGAEFQVYRLAEAGETAVETITYNGEEVGIVPVASEDGAVMLKTDETGYATSPELEYGLYFLLETKAPLGCIPLEEAVAAWVNVESVSASYAVQIPNTSITVLPATGGMGTTIFTIGGVAIIVAAAGLFLVSRRRVAR